ncbi:hypothetical protein ACWC1K_15010, partial [Streptomyces sp. NPDC001492]
MPGNKAVEPPCPTALRRPPAQRHRPSEAHRTAGHRPGGSRRGIQNATSGSYFGGQICGPIYKEVMEFALKTLQ